MRPRKATTAPCREELVVRNKMKPVIACLAFAPLPAQARAAESNSTMRVWMPHGIQILTSSQTPKAHTSTGLQRPFEGAPDCVCVQTRRSRSHPLFSEGGFDLPLPRCATTLTGSRPSLSLARGRRRGARSGKDTKKGSYLVDPASSHMLVSKI